MACSDGPLVLNAKVLVEGAAEGQLLMSTTPLSFWGGVNPTTGEIIDRNHPLSGISITGKILAIPSGRGSCTGSGIILQLIYNGVNPSALVFEHEEDILTLGVIIAQQFFGKSIPVLRLDSFDFKKLSTIPYARIMNDKLYSHMDVGENIPVALSIKGVHELDKEIQLPPNFEMSNYDHLVLTGSMGKAAQTAMRVILKMAIVQGATSLIDITQVHIDGCIYTGEATLLVAKKLLKLGGKVCVPTTMNSISIDRRQWRTQGVDPAIGGPSEELAETYEGLGAQATYTCAPYLLDSAPKIGEQVGWAESNAVVYANSALGARTMKYPDYLDICIALTGRAPKAGCHVLENRRAQIKMSVPTLPSFDDSLFPLLGYLVGDIARSRIPIVTGLEETTVTNADLKTFGAAFATTSSAPMFHIAGVTPEAKTADDQALHLSTNVAAAITRTTMAAAWRRLDKAPETAVDLVSLGNPHFSYEELRDTAALVRGRTKHSGTEIMITCGWDTYQKTLGTVVIEELREFGVKIITDTCWCMIEEPVIPRHARTIMTNSGKYAHYGEGLTGRKMRFGSLAACVEAACTGVADKCVPVWL
ncbi:hypothetical protein SLS56_009765 [Neofusicoccum ribis]|uniref:DUF521 domain protein n=1 Tax=Neofusicoccum ribis TaxID=45134 RepID=A0ABR3SGC9_9PEZI